MKVLVMNKEFWIFNIPDDTKDIQDYIDEHFDTESIDAIEYSDTYYEFMEILEDEDE